MVKKEKIPDQAVEMFEKVSSGFEGSRPYMVGLDIAFDRGKKPVLLELNSTPGLAWYGDEEVKTHKEKAMKKLLRSFDNLI